MMMMMMMPLSILMLYDVITSTRWNEGLSLFVIQRLNYSLCYFLQIYCWRLRLEVLPAWKFANIDCQQTQHTFGEWFSWYCWQLTWSVPHDTPAAWPCYGHRFFNDTSFNLGIGAGGGVFRKGPSWDVGETWKQNWQWWFQKDHSIPKIYLNIQTLTNWLLSHFLPRLPW